MPTLLALAVGLAALAGCGGSSSNSTSSTSSNPTTSSRREHGASYAGTRDVERGAEKLSLRGQPGQGS